MTALMPRQALIAAAAHGCTAGQPPQTLRPCKVAAAAASPEDGCLAVKGDAAALLREQLGVGGGQVLPCGNNMDNRGATGMAGDMALATFGRSIAAPATAWTTAGSSRASSQEGARAAQPQANPALHSHNQPLCSQLPSTVFMLYSRSVASSKGRW